MALCDQSQMTKAAGSISAARQRSRSPRKSGRNSLSFTLQDALDLVAANKKFYHKRLISPEGITIDLFNYRNGAREKDFLATEVCIEMRGLCFVDGKRFLALPKFFNLNEVSSTSLQLVRNKEIASITDKVDGSLVRFIRVGDATVAKSKMCLDNAMAEAANKMLAADEHLRAFVNDMLDQNIAAHFEYVSASNQIVLYYEKPRLVLHSARCEKTGKFLRLSDIAHRRVDVVETFPIVSLEELNERCKSEKGREGYVVEFADGQLVKIKTLWYLEQHSGWQQRAILRDLVEGGTLNRGFLLKTILDNALDDIKACFIANSTLCEELDQVETAVLNYLTTSVEKLQAVIDACANNPSTLAKKCKAAGYITFVERVLPRYLQTRAADEEELFQCIAEDMRCADAGTGMIVQMLAPGCSLRL